MSDLDVLESESVYIPREACDRDQPPEFRNTDFPPGGHVRTHPLPGRAGITMPFR